jgi:nucleoside-diphosphate-sugar epimerase
METLNNGKELNVVFGTGPLGISVARELIARGKRVRLVNRSGKADAPKDAEIVKGDATDLKTVRSICNGASVVYNCASPAYTEWPQKFPPIMDGIIEGAASAEAKLIFGDNLYMYGPITGRLKEDLPYKATGHKGRTRAAVANRLIDAHKSGKVQAAIGRSSTFFGPGVLTSMMGERVFAPALKGETASLLGSLDQPHTYTFINDFARGLVTLGEHEEALGNVWHIPSAETITTREFVDLIFKEAGYPTKVRVAPKLLVSMMSLFNPMIRELKEVLYQHEQPFIVDHSKYKEAFGDTSTPHKEAIRQTLNWYKQIISN